MPCSPNSRFISRNGAAFGSTGSKGMESSFSMSSAVLRGNSTVALVISVRWR